MCDPELHVTRRAWWAHQWILMTHRELLVSAKMGRGAESRGPLVSKPSCLARNQVNKIRVEIVQLEEVILTWRLCGAGGRTEKKSPESRALAFLMCLSLRCAWRCSGSWCLRDKISSSGDNALECPAEMADVSLLFSVWVLWYGRDCQGNGRFISLFNFFLPRENVV